VNLVFAPQGWEDYLYWQRNDPEMLSRINLLIKDIMRHPYAGIGKPEPLKHALQGFWSRRITSEHRIVYKKVGNEIFIAQLRFQYC
jgi:toxin YoeB